MHCSLHCNLHCSLRCNLQYMHCSLRCNLHFAHHTSPSTRLLHTSIHTSIHTASSRRSTSEAVHGDLAPIGRHPVRLTLILALALTPPPGAPCV